MANAGEASVNLVVSSVGIKVAEYLQNEFDTPYIVGVPYGDQMKNELLKSIVGASNNVGANARGARVGASFTSPLFLSDLGSKFKHEKIYIIGESVTSKSLAKYIYYKYGHTAKVISAVELGNTYHGDIVKNLKD